MEIYEFINSKDIREHCRNIGYEFNTKECLFLIWQSRRHTIAEKHSAYHEIMQSMPNSRFLIGQKPIELFDFIQKYMAIENELTEVINMETAGVFFYAVRGEDMVGFYPSKEMCIEAIKHRFGIICPEYCCLKFRPLAKQFDDDLAGDVRLYLNGNWETAYMWEKSFLPNDKSKIFSIFQDWHFDIPMPFKKDNLVIERYSGRGTIFKFDPALLEFNEYGMSLYSGDSQDDKVIYYTENYLNLEYV